jgi:magnesium chelatase subunit D
VNKVSLVISHWSLAKNKGQVTMEKATFPFTAVVGMDQAKQALLLLAVEPGLKGVLLATGPGMAKSVLVRAFRSILPTTDRGPRTTDHRPSSIVHRPFVELPLNVTEDRLLGSLDIEQILATGKRQLVPGLLAEAHGGILYVDEINLLDTSVANHIGMALSTGLVRLEREGVSTTCPTDFLLIGTYNPEEGQKQPSLADRVGLLVTEAEPSPLDARVEIINRVVAYDHDPVAFVRQYARETAKLQKVIREARDRYPQVEIAPDDRRRLSLAALRLGVEGNRADIFAVRAARASAALAARACVGEDDLKIALQLVLIPRATVVPHEIAECGMQNSDHRPQTTNHRPKNPQSAIRNPQSGNPQSAIRNPQSEDLIIQALDGNLPEEILRPWSLVPGPWLITRGKGQRTKDKGQRTMMVSYKRGRYVSAVPGGGGRIALDATLRAAALMAGRCRHDRRNGRIAITVDKTDLRFKRFKQKAGMLFIFVIDASGSMALNRMNQAKGAITRLLQQAYIHRDKVSLVSFRGDRAEVHLAPSRSVELAKRSLDALPVGGVTPLAAGLLAALDLAKQARASGIRQTLLVLVTDGRANVALKKDLRPQTSDLRPQFSATSDQRPVTNSQQAIWNELGHVGALLQSHGITTVVIDTQHRFTSNGAGQRLAELLGGRYVYLPRPDANAVYKAIASAAETVRA